jgi:rare lipoprotein A
LAGTALWIAACRAAGPPAEPPAPAVYEQGIASWYGPGFEGRPTASGEPFDPGALTAAHPRLPFGTRVRVVNVGNAREVVVRINDRGPFTAGRIIDVSRAAAEALGFLRAGTATVRLILDDSR